MLIQTRKPITQIGEVRFPGPTYVTTNEIKGAADVHIDGFDVPLRIIVHAVKDLKTGQYRSFDIELDAPKAMKTRMVRTMDPKRLSRIELPDTGV